jgi:hypothetical protein
LSSSLFVLALLEIASPRQGSAFTGQFYHSKRLGFIQDEGCNNSLLFSKIYLFLKIKNKK